MKTFELPDTTQERIVELRKIEREWGIANYKHDLRELVQIQEEYRAQQHVLLR